MRLILTLIALLAANSAMAAKVVDVFDCDFKKSRPMLSQKVMIIKDAPGQYLVLDGMIHAREGEPLRAEVLEDGKKKLVLRWSLFVPDRTGTQAKLAYRLAYFKSSQKVNISVQAMGFTNQTNNRGTCKTTKMRF